MSIIEKGGLYTAGGRWVDSEKPSNGEIVDLVEKFKSTAESREEKLNNTAKEIVEAFPENQKQTIMGHCDSVIKLFKDVVKHIETLSEKAGLQVQPPSAPRM